MISQKSAENSQRLQSISYPTEGSEICFSIEDASFWFRHRNDCIRAVINRFSIRGVILDIGGGNGYVSRMLKDMGLSPVLIEPSMSACANAKKRGLTDVVCSTLENLDPQKFKSDAVCLFDILEHIQDEDYFLGALRTLLRDEGKLLITVPAYPQLWSEADIIFGHIRRYSFNTLKSKLEKNGYKVIYSNYFFRFLFLPALLFRRLPYLFGRKEAKGTDVIRAQSIVKNKLMKILVGLLIKEELWAFSCGRIPFGTSIFVVAQVK